jgi:hypothetical protein
MKKVTVSLMAFTFAFALGVGSTFFVAEEANADLVVCVDVTPDVGVRTDNWCYPYYPRTKLIIGYWVNFYDGRVDGTGAPCNFLYSVCVVDNRQFPAQDFAK